MSAFFVSKMGTLSGLSMPHNRHSFRAVTFFFVCVTLIANRSILMDLLDTCTRNAARFTFNSMQTSILMHFQ